MTLPRDFDLDAITKAEKLQGMFLVTSVTTCPAFALYLAAKSEHLHCSRGIVCIIDDPVYSR